MRKKTKYLAMLVITLAVCFSIFSVVLAATLANWGFEKGNLSGWKTFYENTGRWVVYSGTSIPQGRGTFYSPPEGEFAAATRQRRPSVQILYRDIVLEPGYSHELSFWVSYKNYYGAGFFTPDSLLLDPGERNQQYRIDLIDPSASIVSVSPGDVLVALFRTEVGDPQMVAPALHTFNLDAFAGQTVRLRFAVADSVGFFAGAVDDVRIESERNNAPPDTSGAYADRSCIRSRNHKMVDVGVEGVIDPDGDPVTITIVGITSDEPTDGSGDGDGKHTPDAAGLGTSTATVRAERSGGGDGRVYVITFIAEDGYGGVSEGSVTVGVPFDKSGKGCSAIDTGQNYDATQ